jgi:hypothetical protein
MVDGFEARTSGNPACMATSRWHVSNSGNAAARIIGGVGALFAVIEIVYILLVLFGANPANAFYRFMQTIAQPLALFFPGLFQLTNPKLEILLNYGLAAVFWLVVTGLIARVVDR